MNYIEVLPYRIQIEQANDLLHRVVQLVSQGAKDDSLFADIKSYLSSDGRCADD